VKLHRLSTDKGSFLFSATAVLHSNLFDSCITCFIFTPIEQWNKPIREKFTGERWKGASYIGLVFTNKNNQYVISGEAEIKIDITKTEFETSSKKAINYEEKLCDKGMGWRSRYYNCKRPTTTSIGGAVYSYYESNDSEKCLYSTHIRTNNGLVDYYLGNSPECVEKFDSLVNQNIISILAQPTKQEPIDISHTFTKSLCKADQMLLF
jgi:hypothetical protein